MSLFNVPDRKVIPRWRDYMASPVRQELAPLQFKAIKQAVPAQLDEKREEFNMHRTASFAADLVGCAVVLGLDKEVRDAADFLLAQTDAGLRGAQMLARGVLGITQSSPYNEIVQSRENPARPFIKLLRRMLSWEGRDPFAWSDLARRYTILGYPEKARRAMSTALQLAPENRLVMRSASRCFVHLHDLERAHNAVCRGKLHLIDPWLLSAEIAISCAQGKTSAFVKQAKRILQAEQWPAYHVSELACALGTLEFFAGNHRAARSLIHKSMEQPTENTVAQVSFLTNTNRIPIVDTSKCQVNSAEASSWDSYFNGNWAEVLKQSQEWWEDQPFSGRPDILGSHVAVLIGDFSLGMKRASRAIKANPGEFMLINNLAVAMANNGNVEGAAKTFCQIPVGRLNSQEKVVWLATSGLLRYRNGDVLGGSIAYRDAFDLAESLGSSRLAVFAAIHHAMEALRAGTPNAEGQRESALRDYSDFDDAAVKYLLKNLRSQRPLLANRA